MSESMLYYAPLILIVVGNVLYNVVGKAGPMKRIPSQRSSSRIW